MKAISWLLDNRLLVLLATVLLTAGGVAAWRSLPIDAFPDVTNTQVMVLAKAPGLAAVDVEERVSFPIEQAMRGLPRVRQVRSLSKAGLSQVVVVFEDGADTWWTRQVVFERLGAAREALPPGVTPELGPISTGLGEIFQYTLESERHSPMELRTLQDWVVAPLLKPVAGVNEVNSFGGAVKQYQVLVHPDRLVKYGLSIREVDGRAGAVERQRRRRRARERLGADLPAWRGAPPGHPRHRAGGPEGAGRHSRLRAGHRRRRDRRGATAGSGDPRRQGRDRRRHGDHAEGGELEGRGHEGEGRHREGPGSAPGGRPGRRVLRPDVPHRGEHRDGHRRAPRGRPVRDPGALPVRGGAPDGARRPLLPPLHVPGELHRHGAARAHVQPHEPGRARLLGGHGGGRLHRRRREREAAPGGVAGRRRITGASSPGP